MAPPTPGARERDAAGEGVVASDARAVSVAALLGVPPDAEALDDAEGSREERPEPVQTEVSVAVEAALSEGDAISSSDAEAGVLNEGRGVLDTTAD